VEEGVELARESGIEFHDASGIDQAKFDEMYLREARRNAESLARYGIDGISVFEKARASIRPYSTISCKEPSL